MREEREGIAVADRCIDDDFVAVIEGVGGMHDDAGRSPEPAGVRAVTVTPDKSPVGRCVLVEGPVQVTFPQSFHPGDVTIDREDEVFLGQHHVMQGADVGHLHPDFTFQASVGCERIYPQVVGTHAGGFVPVADQVTSNGVYLRMGAEGLGLELAVEVPGPQGFQGVGIDLDGVGVFLQGVQPATKGQRGGIGHRGQVGPVQVTYRGIVSERVAVDAIELLACRQVVAKTRRLHPARPEIDDTVPDAETADIPIGGEGAVVGPGGGIKPFPTDADESAVEICGYGAFHFAVIDVRLEALWGEETGGRRAVGEINHGIVPALYSLLC